MWHVSGQNDASIELNILPEIQRSQESQALPSPSVTCVLPNTIKVGDWCVVRYDGAQYPGEVTTVMGKEYHEVSIVIMAGNLWTSTPAKAFYELGDIVQVISPPEVAGSIGQFREI